MLLEALEGGFMRISGRSEPGISCSEHVSVYWGRCTNVLFLDCLLMFLFVFLSLFFILDYSFFLICCMLDDSKSLIETI